MIVMLGDRVRLQFLILGIGGEGIGLAEIAALMEE
ncbi:hypothetical protein SAMN05421505_102280 [Sinosporangium album]|uniref:Uncharacterized protein n=1 Tax=Sinosporangium album TaxID=504805 RepID=A0A1G7SF18_9ACTN|nr:hypothetical protein SAMN05421505_102280 [Sinosporangium album]